MFSSEDVRWKIVLGTVAVILFTTVSIGLIAQIRCQSSLQRCTMENASWCNNSMMCVDYGQGKMLCSPGYCTQVNIYAREIKTGSIKATAFVEEMIHTGTEKTAKGIAWVQMKWTKWRQK